MSFINLLVVNGRCWMEVGLSECELIGVFWCVVFFNSGLGLVMIVLFC